MGSVEKFFVVVSVQRAPDGKIVLTSLPVETLEGKSVEKALKPVLQTEEERLMQRMSRVVAKEMGVTQLFKQLPQHPKHVYVQWILSNEEYEKLGKPTIDSPVKITLELNKKET